MGGKGIPPAPSSQDADAHPDDMAAKELVSNLTEKHTQVLTAGKRAHVVSQILAAYGSSNFYSLELCKASRAVATLLSFYGYGFAVPGLGPCLGLGPEFDWRGPGAGSLQGNIRGTSVLEHGTENNARAPGIFDKNAA